MADMTPAEKAELRRQKILAKKKARMAFVVENDRSQLSNPAETPPSTTTPPTMATTVDTAGTTEAPAGTTEAPAGTTEAPAGTTTGTTITCELPQSLMAATDQQPFSSHSMPTPQPQFFPTSSLHPPPPTIPFFPSFAPPSFAPPPQQPNPQLNYRVGESPRLLLIILLAIMLAMPSISSQNPLSVIESFILLRVLIDVLPLIESARAALHYVQTFRVSWFDVATRLPMAFMLTRSLWKEFALYLTVTLVTVSLLRYSTW